MDKLKSVNIYLMSSKYKFDDREVSHEVNQETKIREGAMFIYQNQKKATST